MKQLTKHISVLHPQTHINIIKSLLSDSSHNNEQHKEISLTFGLFHVWQLCMMGFEMHHKRKVDINLDVMSLSPAENSQIKVKWNTQTQASDCKQQWKQNVNEKVRSAGLSFTRSIKPSGLWKAGMKDNLWKKG